MDPRIQYCVREIERKILHENAEYSALDALLQKLARDTRLTRFHLAHLFRENLNSSPRDYMHRNLMGHCALMVAHTREPIFSIAINTGFASQQTFTRAFTHYWGIPPCKFRQAHAHYVMSHDQPAPGETPRPAQVHIDNPASTLNLWAVRYEGLSCQRHACWNNFWKLCQQLPPDMRKGPFFGLTYDTSMFVPMQFVRYYCGIQVPQDSGKKPEGAFEITLPKGKVAHCDGEIYSHEISSLYSYLLDHWLPESGYSMTATCLVERFDQFPRDWDARRAPVRLSCWVRKM